MISSSLRHPPHGPSLDGLYAFTTTIHDQTYNHPWDPLLYGIYPGQVDQEVNVSLSTGWIPVLSELVIGFLLISWSRYRWWFYLRRSIYGKIWMDDNVECTTGCLLAISAHIDCACYFRYVITDSLWLVNILEHGGPCFPQDLSKFIY